MGRAFAMLLGMFALAACGTRDNGESAPLRVLLIPADGGTESGTLADYRPIFDAVGRQTGTRFDLTVAQSYAAVVEAICGGGADIAFVGPATYLQADARGCAELLAVAVKGGRSVYYSGLFVHADAPIMSVSDLRGRRVALGDVNSTSSFILPVTMMMEAGLNPARDLAEVRITGSHVNSLSALAAGHVDAAALSLVSYERAVREGVPGADRLRLLARSGPIPYPPLIVSRRLSEDRRRRLRDAFDHVADAPGVRSEMIRGYGGGAVDGYDGHFPRERFRPMAQKMAMVSDTLKGELLRLSAER